MYIRRILLTLLISCILLVVPLTAWGETLFTDSFYDTSKVDMTKTTATVDLEEHCVRLPLRSLVNAIAVQEDSIGYVVATSNGIIMYDYDDATGSVVENSAFSAPWVTDAIGVSLRQDNLNIWSITEGSLSYYKLSGSAMSSDPALKVTGLNDVLSVTAFKNRDSALILQRKEGTAKISRYNQGSINPVTVFQADIPDPISISIVGDSPDFILTTRTGQFYFMYDDAGNTYYENMAYRLTITDAISSSSDDAASVIATDNEIKYYMFNDLGPPVAVTAFSKAISSKPIAVSLRPGQFEYAYIDEYGAVKYYIYDEATNQMVRDTSLETQGHSLNKGYGHPKDYYSKEYISSKPYDAAMLTVSQSIPSGTSIRYYISSNGGTTWTEAILGTWVQVPLGDRFVVRAVLDTSDNQVTPKIFQVTLMVDDDYKIDATIDQMVERGRNCEITAEVTRLTTGDPIDVDSIEVTVPIDKLAPGETPITGTMTYDPEDGKYKFTFLVPELTQVGYWPDNGYYQARIVATKGISQKEVLVDFEVQGHIFRRLVIRTTTW